MRHALLRYVVGFHDSAFGFDPTFAYFEYALNFKLRLY